MLTLLLTLFACEPTAADKADTGTADTDTDTDADTDADSDTDTDTDTDADTDADTDTDTDADTDYTLVVATVASDYTVGQLATVDGRSGAVDDAILPTTSDPVVVVEGGKVFLLNRSSENTVQMFEPGDLTTPSVEFSTGDSSNPQDLGVCGDKAVVSLYGTDYLAVYDLGSGLAYGTIDLAAYADADGMPEASTIVTGADGDLYVALDELDTSGYPWTSADGTGTVLHIDCDTLTIADEWTVGPNPSLMPDPMDATKLLVRTGDYYNADYSAKLDGSVYRFDPATGTMSDALINEVDLGYNIGAIAGGSNGKAIMVIDDAYSWGVDCIDLDDWSVTPSDPVDSFIGDAQAAPDGTVWVSYRAGYAGDGSPVIEGLVAWHPDTCTSAPAITTLFPPYSLALLQ